MYSFRHAHLHNSRAGDRSSQRLTGAAGQERPYYRLRRRSVQKDDPPAGHCGPQLYTLPASFLPEGRSHRPSHRHVGTGAHLQGLYSDPAGGFPAMLLPGQKLNQGRELNQAWELNQGRELNPDCSGFPVTDSQGRKLNPGRELNPGRKLNQGWEPAL